jgi:hypothetical protein
LWQSSLNNNATACPQAMDDGIYAYLGYKIFAVEKQLMGIASLIKEVS